MLFLTQWGGGRGGVSTYSYLYKIKTKINTHTQWKISYDKFVYLVKTMEGYNTWSQNVSLIFLII